MAQRQDDWWTGDPVVSTSPAAAPGGLVAVTPPRQPPPARPEEITGTNLRNTRTQQEIQQGEYTTTATPVRNRYSDESQLRSAFERLPAVQNYQVVVPQYVAARNAADTRAGDLNLIYAFGKIMDPGSVVREGEMVMAQGTGAIQDRLRGIMGELDRRGRLSPETRADLLAELRTRRHELSTSYNAARAQYEGIAREYGFNPGNVVGQHPAAPYTNVDEQRGGPVDTRPTEGYVPAAHAAPPQTDNPLSAEQQAAYDAFSRANPRATAAQITQFFSGIGMTIHNADEIVRARDEAPEGTPVASGATAHYPAPDISAMRGQGGAVETVDSGLRAAANAVTLGGADYAAAGVDAALTDRTIGESVRREHAITDYDFEHHPIAATVGTVGGGLLLPTGALSDARAAAMTAMRSTGSREAALQAARSAVSRRLALESGAYGGVHGALSSDGDIEDRIATSAVESVMGLTTAYGLGRFAPARAFGGRRMPRPSTRPPLVDPITERLNQPLEGAPPAERVAAGNAYGLDLPLGAAGGRPAAILEKGLDIVPGSAGVMEDARAGLRGQVDAAVENVAGGYGTAQTQRAGGEALQRGARNWISRFDRISGTAYERIPIAPASTASTANTQSRLGELTSRFSSNADFADAFRDGQLERWRDALANGRLSWEDLKEFRSRVGEMIGERRFDERTSTSDLRSLYAALSDDMRATAEANGPRALRAFERANNLYREGQTRIEESLSTILGNDGRTNPEAAAATVQTIARSGRRSSNFEQLRQIRNSTLKNGEWDEVASSVIRLMGQPTNSTGREFNPQTFVQSYADMSEDARGLLFGGRGRRAELRKALDGFVEVAQRLAGSNALRNTSNTAPGITGAGAVMTGGAAMLNPLLGVKMAAGVAANYGMARLWTNPAFVRWATGYARAVERGAASGRPNAHALLGRREALAQIAREQPEIAAELTDLDQTLFGDDSER